MQFRVLDLMEKAASSLTLEDVIRKHPIPTTHAYSSKFFVNKKMLLGKVEGSTEVHVVKNPILFQSIDSAICNNFSYQLVL